MKPTAVYFPFTYISENTAACLNTCFGKIIVYQPTQSNTPIILKDLEEKHLIQLRYPFQQDDEKIFAICSEYQNYGNLFHKDGLSSLKAKPGEVPFFNSSSTHKIKDDIQGHLTEKPTQTVSSDMISRVFLQLSQEFDQTREETEKELHTIKIREKSLLSELRGEHTEDIAKASGNEDIGGYLPKDRISSWARLMLNDSDLPGLFVTGSQAIWNYLTDRLPNTEIVLDHNEIHIDPASDNKQHTGLTSYIETILGKPWPQPGLVKPSLPSRGTGQKYFFSLLIIPQIDPYTCFSSLFVGLESKEQRDQPKNLHSHTLIALVTNE